MASHSHPTLTHIYITRKLNRQQKSEVHETGNKYTRLKQRKRVKYQKDIYVKVLKDKKRKGPKI